MAGKSSEQAPDDPLIARCADVLLDPPGSEELLAEYAALADGYRALSRKLYKTMHISDGYQGQVKEMAIKLERMMAKINQLREVALPLCIYCRKVRPQSEDYWQKLETFLSRNADIMFTQGICPECLKATYARMGATDTSTNPGLVPAPGPVKRQKRRAVQDAAPEEAQELRRMAGSLNKDDACSGELLRLADRYEKLSRRFDKTVTISDSYQSQLRDLNVRLELLARTDLLTGLANRWEMTHRMEMEHSRIQRHGGGFSIILGDVDHFKLINDTHGHQCGDAVLRNIATLMQSSLRTEDLCARWGGEEFMILLPETNAKAALAVAVKLGELIRTSPCIWNGQGVTVTMSYGVMELNPGVDLDKGISAADDALYEAKAQGRDCAVLSQVSGA